MGGRMIIIKKDEKYADICNTCRSRKNVYLLKFSKKNMTRSTGISICENCLRELRQEIDNVLKTAKIPVVGGVDGNE